MSTATWATSPAYGRTVVLGPTQRLVYDVVLRMTESGRRPELTLSRLSGLTGRPISSVHDALGRLRALGLIGVSARMGRHGGHRLWRVTRPSDRGLDLGKHRRAVARIIRRFALAITQAAPVPPARSGDGSSPTDPTAPPERSGPSIPAGSPPSSAQADGDPASLDEGERPWWDKGPTYVPVPGETFAEKLRRYGLGQWIEERDR